MLHLRKDSKSPYPNSQPRFGDRGFHIDSGCVSSLELLYNIVGGWQRPANRSKHIRLINTAFKDVSGGQSYHCRFSCSRNDLRYEETLASHACCWRISEK